MGVAVAKLALYFLSRRKDGDRLLRRNEIGVTMRLRGIILEYYVYVEIGTDMYLA
jgi:hypothetical protein